MTQTYHRHEDAAMALKPLTTRFKLYKKIKKKPVCSTEFLPDLSCVGVAHHILIDSCTASATH